MTGSGWLVALAALLVLVGAVLALLTVRIALRLDRLHVRTDGAWTALDGLLGRRAAVVRTLVAARRLPSGRADGLRRAAEQAMLAGTRNREAAENALGTQLAVLDRHRLGPELAAELADVEARVAIARQVYNDAVRDTLALRSRCAVRWLHLAGNAPLPRFFELAEPVSGVGGYNPTNHSRAHTGQRSG